MNFEFMGLNCDFSGLRRVKATNLAMEKRALVLGLALTLPLALYGIPYAYAVSAQTTYVVNSPFQHYDKEDPVKVQCLSPSDYTLHWSHVSLLVSNPIIAYSLNSAGTRAATGDTPNGWEINLIMGSNQDQIQIYCQSPVTVAGVSVPEFGSLYVAIALGAVVYFMMSRRYARRPTTSADLKAYQSMEA